MSDIFDSNMMVKTHNQNTLNSQITTIKKLNYFMLYIFIFSFMRGTEYQLGKE